MTEKSKILIVIMSCNNDFFIEQEKTLKETYLSILPDNVDYVIYRGGNNKDEFRENKHLLLLNVEDDLHNTYKKTYKALDYIHDNFNYDYILRTNTSTYININLLVAFVQNLEDTDKYNDNVWGAEYVKHIEETNVCKNIPYIRGNAILLSVPNVLDILDYGKSYTYMNNTALIDDEIIGIILYAILGDDYLKCFGEAWYKSIPNYCTYPTSICNMNNDNIDFSYVKNFIAIQIKNWYNRELENTHFKIMHKVFTENVDNDINKTIENIHKYSENPDIFLGESHGFHRSNDVKSYIQISL